MTDDATTETLNRRRSTVLVRFGVIALALPLLAACNEQTDAGATPEDPSQAAGAQEEAAQ